MRVKKPFVMPSVVYVWKEENRDHSFDLLAAKEVEERGEGYVGIYDLREIVETRYLPQIRRMGTKGWFPIAKR